MKHFEIKELDYENYAFTMQEVVGGSRPRLVLEKGPNKLKHFLKSYSHDPREIMAELLASKLGLIGGFKIQKTWIKTFPPALIKFFEEKYPGYLPEGWEPIGALIKNIFPKGYNVQYGFSIVNKDPTAKLKLSDLGNAISERYYAPQQLLQSLAEMIVFDAWIGNMDRHHENWGILESSKYDFKQRTMFPKDSISKRRFTDLFDHGSSLLFELREEEVIGFLKNKDRFIDKYIFGKSYSHILSENGEETNIFNLIKFYLKKDSEWSIYFCKAIEKIEAIDMLEVAKLILQMPRHKSINYSDERRQLLFLSLRVRMDELFKLKNSI